MQIWSCDNLLNSHSGFHVCWMKSSYPTCHRALCCTTPANLSSSTFQPDVPGFADTSTGDFCSRSPLYIEDPMVLLPVNVSDKFHTPL